MPGPVFEIYNEDGTLQLNLASRLTKFLGVISMTAASGSQFNQYLDMGTPWYCFAGLIEAQDRQSALPNISFSGKYLNWSDGNINPADGLQVMYGVYSNGNN